jgi:hypothetical protein
MMFPVSRVLDTALAKGDSLPTIQGVRVQSQPATTLLCALVLSLFLMPAWGQLFLP